jgi:L,D-peptidoglycan transpeptidase YkuD (ErfK/YbiS/YcfS/YnhG family)
MIKSFLILLSISIYAFSSQQIILVVSDDTNSSHAKLSCYEDNKKVFESISVNLGKNGLGLGIGEKQLSKDPQEPLKYEGDKKAPIGVFQLTALFGYTHKHHYKMPYLYTSEDLLCVDDSNSHFYNQIIQANGDEKSFEHMKRKDNQYQLGIVVAHNKKREKQRGSCIFIHVQKFPGATTLGCTSMSLEDLQKIANWLEISKNPLLIQIPKKRLQEILKLYPQLR